LSNSAKAGTGTNEHRVRLVAVREPEPSSVCRVRKREASHPWAGEVRFDIEEADPIRSLIGRSRNPVSFNDDLPGLCSEAGRKNQKENRQCFFR
jgi:hypothetical protein